MRAIGSALRCYDGAYVSPVGRFLQNEPDLERRSQEHYVYCAQNPVIRVDADGAAWTDAPGSGAVADALRSEQTFLQNRISEADAWWGKSKEVRGYERRLEEIKLLLQNYQGNRARLPSSDPNACRLQDVEDEKGWLEDWADFFGGWGDTLTSIPFTDWSLTKGARQLFGTDDRVDTSSGWYTIGQVTGTAHGLLLGGAGAARAAARGPGAGRVFSHFVPDRFLPGRLGQWLGKGGPLSRLGGDYVSRLRHAQTDFWSKLAGSTTVKHSDWIGRLLGGGTNPEKWNLFSSLVDRMPGLLILIYGGTEGAQGIYNLSTKPSNGKKRCECP